MYYEVYRNNIVQERYDNPVEVYKNNILQEVCETVSKPKTYSHTLLDSIELS